MKRYAATKNSPPWTGYSTPTFKTKVYDVIKLAGDVGATRKEVADKVGLNTGRVSTYLAELKRAGLVYRVGDAVDPATLNATDSALYAMNALENAIIARATEVGITADVTKAFTRYQKIKALALGAKTDGEARAALRASLIDLIKLTF